MSRKPSPKLPTVNKSEAVSLDHGIIADPSLAAWAKLAKLGLSDALIHKLRATAGGAGLTLLAGAAGSGKAMSAAAIANALSRPLQRLDLASLARAAIGETERYLDAAFDAAQRAGAVLLIDEADALLHKRSAVRDAHDRYANIEIAYLLARIERFEGLVILTACRKQDIDTAVLRRIRHSIDFPGPSPDSA